MEAPPRTRTFAKQLRRAMTLPEVLLWTQLKARKLDGLHFRRQHPEGPYILDFYCETVRLCVEVDGQGHGFGDRPERDERGDAWLADQGIRTLRLNASYVLSEMDGTLATIRAALDPPPGA
ncbi:endonuclease domain-containing protein [soil metagenome]